MSQPCCMSPHRAEFPPNCRPALFPKEEEWNSVIETNLNAIYRLSKACLRDMLKARWGRIINISSVVGSTGNAGQANYAAAKAGLIGFTKALAQEVGSRDITVNAIAPGHVETEQAERADNPYIPLDQKSALPEDIAKMAVLLASEEVTGRITGVSIPVDGGERLYGEWVDRLKPGG